MLLQGEKERDEKERGNKRSCIDYLTQLTGRVQETTDIYFWRKQVNVLSKRSFSKTEQQYQLFPV